MLIDSDLKAFTMAAMQGLCANPYSVERHGTDSIPSEAIRVAAATLNALNKAGAPTAPVLEVWHSCKDELPPADNLEDEVSETVLIDLDGNMKYYAVGYYDHELQSWMMEGDVSFLDINHAKYKFIN